MLDEVKEYAEDLWWLLVLGGVTSVLFGLVAIFMPGLTLVSLIVAFAVFAIVWGGDRLNHWPGID